MLTAAIVLSLRYNRLALARDAADRSVQDA
jgi:hypothetical protein